MEKGTLTQEDEELMGQYGEYRQIKKGALLHREGMVANYASTQRLTPETLRRFCIKLPQYLQSHSALYDRFLPRYFKKNTDKG